MLKFEIYLFQIFLNKTSYIIQRLINTKKYKEI